MIIMFGYVGMHTLPREQATHSLLNALAWMQSPHVTTFAFCFTSVAMLLHQSLAAQV